MANSSLSAIRPTGPDDPGPTEAEAEAATAADNRPQDRGDPRDTRVTYRVDASTEGLRSLLREIADQIARDSTWSPPGEGVRWQRGYAAAQQAAVSRLRRIAKDCTLKSGHVAVVQEGVNAAGSWYRTECSVCGNVGPRTDLRADAEVIADRHNFVQGFER